MGEICTIRAHSFSFSDHKRMCSFQSQDSPLRLECLNTIIELILQCSLEMPRFFLQCRRCTSVQLLTSITQNLSGEPTTVFAGENLTFKTEGVVTQKLSKNEIDQDSETVQRLSVKRCRVIYQVKWVPIFIIPFYLIFTVSTIILEFDTCLILFKFSILCLIRLSALV